MSQEIELKLTLSREAAKRLAEHPCLKPLESRRFQLGNTYFDTPQQHLEAAHMALRLRRRDDDWVQTLKTAGQESGGLSSRDEWEWAVAPGQLDLAGLASLPPLQDWTRDVLESLSPRFTTDFQRTRWLVTQQNSLVEVALDRGEIAAGQQRVEICELELELKQGETDALWSLAEAFAEKLALRPATLSKAARGGALLRGHWSLPQQEDSPCGLWQRALAALDAHADSGDPTFQTLAGQALVRLAGLENALENPRSARLARILAEALENTGVGHVPHWLDETFGQTALALSRQLADPARSTRT